MIAYNKMIINPTREVINQQSHWIIYESCLEPNKIKKNRKYQRIKRTNGNKHSRSYGKYVKILEKNGKNS